MGSESNIQSLYFVKIMKLTNNIILFLFMFLPFSLEARLEDKILGGVIRINPDTSYQISINANSPTRLGVFVDKSTACETNCVSVKQLNASTSFEYKTDSNAFAKHHPESGKIKIKYSNISDKPIVISIHQYIKHCDAEACAILNKIDIKDPLAFRTMNGEYKRARIASIDTIKTSQDGSWSDVSGTTIFGEPFDITFIWWLYDPNNEISCGQGRYIEIYKMKMEKGEGPALIAGKLIVRDRPIFIEIDTCTGQDSSKPRSTEDL